MLANDLASPALGYTQHLLHMIDGQPSSALKDLIKADVDRKNARFPKAYGSPFLLDSGHVNEAADQLFDSLKGRMAATWRPQLDSLKGEVAMRLGKLAVEQEDLLKVLREKVSRAWARAQVEDERQKQMQTGQAEAAERELIFVENGIASRIEWLNEVLANLENAEPELLGTVLFKPVPYQDY